MTGVLEISHVGCIWSRTVRRNTRWPEILSLSEARLMLPAVGLCRPTVFGTMRGLRIGLISLLSKFATLIRPTRLVCCRGTGMQFMPRAIGARTMVGIGILLPQPSGLGVAGLRTPGVPFPLLPGNRAHFIRADLAIAIPVEATENVCSLADFSVIDHAIVIRIESTEKTGHRTLNFPSRLIAAWFTIAALRAFARWTGSTFWRARFPSGTRLRAVLCDERPRRKRERQRGDECLVWFHRIGGVEKAGRPVGQPFHGRNGEH